MADDSRDIQRQAEVRAEVYRLRRDERKKSEKEDDPESAFRRRVRAKEARDDEELLIP
jgi:hypothetical protein